MAYLVAREGDPVPRDSLVQDVWGLRIDPGSNVVDVVVASLRRKLGGRSGAIETVRGFGYAYQRAEANGRKAHDTAVVLRLTAISHAFSCSDHAALVGQQ